MKSKRGIQKPLKQRRPDNTMTKGIITEDKKKNNGQRKTSLKTNDWSTRTQLNTGLNCLHILIIFLHVDLDRTRWRLFQKRVACTKLDIYFLFITISGSIPLLVGYMSQRLLSVQSSGIGYGLLDIFYYLQFLNNLIISIARVLLLQADVTMSDIDYPGYSRTLIEFCTNP